MPAHASAGEVRYVTAGVVPLTRPQLVGALAGLLLGALLAAIDQTIVGTAEPRITASLSGFDRYPWVGDGVSVDIDVVGADLREPFRHRPR